jgi:hypothetical protein
MIEILYLYLKMCVQTNTYKLKFDKTDNILLTIKNSHQFYLPINQSVYNYIYKIPWNIFREYILLEKNNETFYLHVYSVQHGIHWNQVSILCYRRYIFIPLRIWIDFVWKS